jgi:thiol-disulfide isomerase/thioredoxin
MTWLLAVGAALSTSLALAGDATVAPGQPASSLSDVRWIQGDPITRFETGRVYVVDFWSTWCAGCIDSIAQLNALAQRYESKATFIGVHIWQKEAAPKPAEFLENRSKAGKSILTFAVAEDVDGGIARAWMDATASLGLPTAMILDRSSRLVWFGNAADLDIPLKEVIDGTLDVARSTAEMNRRVRVNRLANESDKAIDREDYDEGTRLILEALAADPDAVSAWIPSTYGHILAVSRSNEVATRFVDAVFATELESTAEMYAGLAHAIFHFRPMELRDLEFALALATLARDASSDNDCQILKLIEDIRAETERPSDDR